MAKRIHLSIDAKLTAVEEVENTKKPKSEIAKSYGVPCSTLSTWLKNKDSLITLMLTTDNFTPTRKRMRKANCSNLDTALMLWFTNARTFNLPISGVIILRAKANSLAEGLGLRIFLASSGWLSRFKKRHDIHFRVISGESKAVTPEQTDYWATTALPKLLADYEPKNIFNADEAGLFY